MGKEELGGFENCTFHAKPAKTFTSLGSRLGGLIAVGSKPASSRLSPSKILELTLFRNLAELIESDVTVC